MKLSKRATRSLIIRASGQKTRLKALPALALQLGVNRMTVHQWWLKGAIPRWWINTVSGLVVWQEKDVAPQANTEAQK